MSRMACTMSSDDVDQCRLKKENMGSDENIFSSFRDRQKPPKNIPCDGNVLHDKKNIPQYERGGEAETESRPHHPLFWKEDTG